MNQNKYCLGEGDSSEEGIDDEDEFIPLSIFERTGPKQVEQIEMETGEIVNIYPSCIAASRAIGIGQRLISECCHGRRYHVGGFKWKFHQLTSTSYDDDQKEPHGKFFYIIIIIIIQY